MKTIIEQTYFISIDLEEHELRNIVWAIKVAEADGFIPTGAAKELVDLAYRLRIISEDE